MMSYSKSILSVSVVAFFVATLFVFSVPAQGEDAGIIYGAYQKNNGMLRIIADPSEARPSENVISWSQSCDCDLSDPEILDDLIQALQDQVDPWHEVGAEENRLLKVIYREKIPTHGATSQRQRSKIDGSHFFLQSSNRQPQLFSRICQVSFISRESSGSHTTI